MKSFVTNNKQVDDYLNYIPFKERTALRSTGIQGGHLIMKKNDLMLLDCTLRDGGYINEWKWGFNTAKYITSALVKAKVDVVEVGFLRNNVDYNCDVTVSNRIEDLNRLLPENTGNTIFSAMAMQSNYDVEQLSDYSGYGIEMIRVTAHDYDIQKGLEYAKIVKERGYKLSINPINIMGYSDEMILQIVNQVNEIQPYQFSIVDTFGSMKRRDLDRIVSLVDNNLDENIRVSLHLHENMSLSFSLAQEFVDKHLNRPVAIDASLMGMGRVPGNLPIELIADYLNDYIDKNYDIDYMMDAIQDYIAPIKGISKWGYSPAFFLSARFNLHRNYAEHFLKKGDLTIRDINHILVRVDASRKTVFDAEYADRIYEEYKDNRIDDSDARKRLKLALKDRNILLIAPGESIISHRNSIDRIIQKNNPVIISINFIPDSFRTDYAFFSNSKRYEKIDGSPCTVIVTSNIYDEKADYVFDYNSLSGAFEKGYNSMIMLMRLLKEIGIESVFLAGADGYKEEGVNYYSGSMMTDIRRGNKYNLEICKAIRNIGLDVVFVTPSAYSNEE